MEHEQLPFFRTGPSPLARLFIFTILSLLLIGADARLKYLETVRQVASVVIYPLQRIAGTPFSIVSRMTEFFTTQSSLRTENARLREEARRLREDPAAIEEIARRELGLIKPGEKLFIVRDVGPADSRTRD